MRYVIFAAFFSLLTFQPNHSHAWGDLGHQVICEMTFQELKRPARNQVRALMRKDPEFRLFSKSCTWPDHPRIRGKEHYVNLERSEQKIEDDPCPSAEKCVVTAILNDSRDLALTDDEADQLRLLKSLGHWVGDVHQPVHVSFADDRGANKIDVDDPCDSNLHSVWDTCIIKKTIGTDARTVAIDLRAELTDADREAWTIGDVGRETVIGWANESFKIAIEPDVEYCVMKNGVCQYSETEVRFEGSVKDVNANMAYLEQHAPTVRLRLKMAAVRLADILNTIWP